jgi:hypothetical protein
MKPEKEIFFTSVTYLNFQGNWLDIFHSQTFSSKELSLEPYLWTQLEISVFQWFFNPFPKLFPIGTILWGSFTDYNMN